jgi:hypothetical protein
MLTSSTKCNKCISEKFWIAKSHFWKLLCRVLGRRHTANVTGSWQPLRFQMIPMCHAHSTWQNQAFAVCIILPCVFLPSARQTCSFAVCPLFAVCYFWDTRQIISLPGARILAYGKRGTHGKLAVSRSNLAPGVVFHFVRIKIFNFTLKIL